MSIDLTFHGAAGDVTGSAYLLTTSRARILIDFGMFQGGRAKEALNVLPEGLDPKSLDAVVLTHAHLDHCGRLPLLAKHGFHGPIFTHAATIELADLVLRDSTFLQAQDIARVNKKRQRAGEAPLDPPYDVADVEAIVKRMKATDYHAVVEVAPGIDACFVEAGHILGSGSLRLRVRDGNDQDKEQRCFVFSGDIGPDGVPILKDPEGFDRADVVILESTYGDRNHKPLADTEDEFEDIVREAVEHGGKILVPVFAIGRTQLILYLLAQMAHEGAIPRFPIYVDSPMAIQATKIYRSHIDMFDEEYHELRRKRPVLQATESFTPTPTREDSIALNDIEGACLIMAGSGMCTGGRILHHFKQNLWKPETSVIIVGFQAYGSLGRMLVDGAESVKIFGEPIAVKARVHTLGGFSAHAGQTGLLNWVAPLAENGGRGSGGSDGNNGNGHGKPRIILTHGEDRARATLAELIQRRHGINCELPQLGETIRV